MIGIFIIWILSSSNENAFVKFFFYVRQSSITCLLNVPGTYLRDWMHAEQTTQRFLPQWNLQQYNFLFIVLFVCLIPRYFIFVFIVDGIGLFILLHSQICYRSIEKCFCNLIIYNWLMCNQSYLQSLLIFISHFFFLHFFQKHSLSSPPI